MRAYIDEYIKETMKRGISMPNPYTPGAGTKPSFLAGRDDTIREITGYIDGVIEGDMARHCIFYGVRGVGKTVLLNKIENIAKDRGVIYCHIECDEHTSLIESVVIRTQEFIEEMHFSERLKNKIQKILQTLSLEYSFTDGKMSVGVGENVNRAKIALSNDVSNLFVTMGEIAKETQNVVCFFIDEIQVAENKQLSALIAAIHRINQIGLPVMMIGAGLPTIQRISGEAKSYAERLFQFVEVSYLDEENAISAIAEPALKYNVHYSQKALKKIVKHTGCYPYFIQELGYCVWNRIVQNWGENDNKKISESDIDSVYEEYMKNLENSFFKVRYNRASKREKDFLFAMLRCKEFPCATANVAKHMRKEQRQISPLRSRLMSKGLIYAPSLGEVDFTVPHFDRYLKKLEKQS